MPKNAVQSAIESGKFTVKSLTAAINSLEQPRLRLAELGIFEERGIKSTTAEIEYQEGHVILVPSGERGKTGPSVGRKKRKAFPVKAVHLALNDAILADDLIGVRAFGTENDAVSFDGAVADIHELHKGSIEATIEYHRWGALRGQILDEDGEIILDLFNLFGIKEADQIDELDFAETEETLDVQILGCKEKSEKYQKGVKARRYHNMCSPELFKKLLANDSFRKAFERYNNGQVFREDVRTGVEWMGCTWESVSDAVGETRFVPEGEALMIPIGNRGLCQTNFAPGDYIECVGTIGLPYYSCGSLLDKNKGIDIESQSNPINICTSLLAVRRLKLK
ncbi:major capsid protein [Aeromonas veronii]|uniref:major capsid protein n=1 Tax=Aeromonas veronii TaxID=654 RepID=UPI003D20260E